MSLITQLYQSSNSVFTIQDLNQIWKNIPLNQVKHYAQYHYQRGNLRRIQRGIYALPERLPDALELGNKIRTPSYISFETVLQREGVIFQWDERIRLASYESRRLQAGGYHFEYSQLKPALLFAAQGVVQHDQYSMAVKERAWLDCLYLNPTMFFDNVRGLNFTLVKSLVKLYQRSTLLAVIARWEAHARSL